MERTFAITTIALSTLVFVPCLAKDADTLKPSDKQFILGTAQAGMTEVKLGELAEKKASSKDVKNFASKMVTDHTKANESLKKIAAEKSVTIPAECDAKHKAIVDKLSKLNGEKFDHDYMDQMVTDHKKVVASLETEAKYGEADLKRWSKTTLPTVQEHLKMAKECDKAIDAKKIK